MAASWTETDIAAFVDGELEGAERARVAALIEADPAAQALADSLRETDALLREAFAAPLSEPVPPSLAAIVKADAKVVPLRPRRPAHSWMPMALAASVALLIGGTAGLMLGQSKGPAAPASLAALSVGGVPLVLAEALDTAPSGTIRGDVQPLASFPLPDGGACREFEVMSPADRAAPTAFGLACNRGEGWRVVIAATVEAPGSTAEGSFAAASGTALDAAAMALDALGAGSALDPAAEAAAIARGWRYE